MGTHRGSNLRRRVGGKEASTYLPGILQSAFAYYRLEEASATRFDSAGVGPYDLSVINTDQPRVTGFHNFAWGPNAPSPYGWLRNTSFDLTTRWPTLAPGISVSCWVTVPGPTYVQGKYMLAENTTGNTAFRFGIGNWVSGTAGHLDFVARNAIATSSAAISVATVPWVNGNWVHVAGTWGLPSYPLLGFGNTDRARCYINGVDQPIQGLPQHIPLIGVRDNGGPGILVGSYSIPGIFRFGDSTYPAYMDELAIFDFNIGADGVKELYNEGVGRFR